MDSSDSCNSFVRVQFLPQSELSNIGKLETRTQANTLFPLFEEKFSIQLTEEQLTMKNPLLLFSVRNKNRLSLANQIMAETLISLETIQSIEATKQIHLKLTRPHDMGELDDWIIIEDSEPLRTLELRPFDKQAKNFLKELKLKANNLQVCHPGTYYEGSVKVKKFVKFSSFYKNTRYILSQTFATFRHRQQLLQAISNFSKYNLLFPRPSDCRYICGDDNNLIRKVQ